VTVPFSYFHRPASTHHIPSDEVNTGLHLAPLSKSLKVNITRCL
jgi:hypothetical protein